MDEKYRKYKKTWQYKMHLLMNFLLFILFGVIIYCAYLFYQTYNGEKENIEKNYSYSINENVVVLLNEGIKQNEYKCASDCDIYGEYFNNGNILLKDGLNFYLYDLVNGKKISANYSDIDFILDKEENIKLFKVTNEKSGIMNLNGTLQIDAIYDELGDKDILGNLNNYLYEKNYIIAKSGSKWGLISLDNGKGLIDFQYDAIKISKYNNLAVKEGNLWYLVDEANKKINTNGYDSIAIYNELLVVAQGKEVYIVNYAGEIQSNKILINFLVDHYLDNNPVSGLYTLLEDNQIMVYVGINNDVFTKYVYDAETKQLIKL